MKLENTYNFIDMLSQAQNQNITLREKILLSESLIEDPRVPRVFGDEFTVMEAERRRQELFARKMKKDFGETLDFDFGDEAPIGAFATNALERLDMQVRRQALRTYATRDIPIYYGGGALESIKGFKEMYQLPKGGFIGGDTNEVRLVKVDFKAQHVPVKPLTYGLRLGLIDSMKNDVVGFDAIAKNSEVISKAFFLDMDRVAYVGERGEDGSTSDTNVDYAGLLNLDNVGVLDLETTTEVDLDTIKKLEHLPIAKVIDIFIHVLNQIAKNVDFDPELVPNKILFYRELYAWLSSPADSYRRGVTPFRTNRMFLQEALDAWTETQQFDKINLVMLPYLSADIGDTKDASMVNAGTNDAGRIVIYRQDPYSLYLPLPLELTGGAVVFDINANAYRRNYLAFIGYLMNFYTDNIYYIDNGETVEITTGTLTVDLNGGTASASQDDVVIEDVVVGSYILDIATLPEPTYSSHTFVGWAFDADGDVPVVANSKFYRTTTIYAIWEEEE